MRIISILIFVTFSVLNFAHSESGGDEFRASHLLRCTQYDSQKLVIDIEKQRIKRGNIDETKILAKVYKNEKGQLVLLGEAPLLLEKRNGWMACDIKIRPAYKAPSVFTSFKMSIDLWDSYGSWLDSSGVQRPVYEGSYDLLYKSRTNTEKLGAPSTCQIYDQGLLAFFNSCRAKI